MMTEQIPPREYVSAIRDFRVAGNLVRDWIALAVSAGARYVVLPARHPDGFCLYDSRISDFSSVHTPSGIDVMAEFVRECRRANLKIGLAYSLHDGRFPKPRVEEVHAQIRELMSNYGTIDYLYYDYEDIPGVAFLRTAAAGREESPETAAAWRAGELNEMVRSLQPDIIINNRSGSREDVDTPEGYIIESCRGRAWEARVDASEAAWTPAALVQNLALAACGAGNLLLRVRPALDGSVDAADRLALQETGRWLIVNGRSIYDCRRRPPGWGTATGAGYLSNLGTTTVRGQTAYLHIFRWPGRTAAIPGVGNRFLSARILSNGASVRIRQTADGRLFLSGLPPRPPDPHNTVIEAVADEPLQTYFYRDVPL